MTFSGGRRALALGFCSATLLLASCGGGSSGDAEGSLRISLTDSQTCAYDAVVVTVARVAVHRSATAGESDPGWETLTLSPAVQVDLMDLRNGVARELGTLPLEAGRYSQVRLVLAENGGSPPYANYLVLPSAPSAPIALRTPSAQQSGLKLNVSATVAAGQRAELTLDFDPCKSVVKAGNSGRYNLKPVITAFVNNVNTVEGYTTAGARVSAQVDGVSVKSTVADASGRFVLWPIEPGTYDVVVTAPGAATGVLERVVVVSGATPVSAAATPLLPPTAASSPERSIGGQVTVAGAAEVYADLRAVQSYGALPRRIEVASATANTTGSYSLTLPTAAPARSTWVSGVTSYTLAADSDTAAAAGRYRVEARAAGFAVAQLLPVPPAAPFDLNLGPVVAADFAFGP